VSGQEVTNSDLVEIAKRNGDFRRNYGLWMGAFLYLRSIRAAQASTIVVASLDGVRGHCVGPDPNASAARSA
jgi:hypothetical protein